jgi:translation initiation factor 1
MNPFDKLKDLRASLPPGEPAKPQAAKPPFLEKVVVRFTRRGHGGKTVTVVSGIAPHALDGMCGEMKRALGCGARIDDGAIILQGDLVDRAIAFLEKKGAQKIARGS